MSSYAAILLSRQPLRPDGTTTWVQQAATAVAWLKENGYGLSSSTGMQTWEMLTALASINKVPLKLYLPLGPADYPEVLFRSVAKQFALNQKLVETVPVRLPDSDNDTAEAKTSLMQHRDRMLVSEADLVLPVSLRQSGNMMSLLEEADEAGKQVLRRFMVPYSKRPTPLDMELNGELNPKLLAMEDDYLIHWTRSTNRSWPDERLLDYYTAILNSHVYPRSGFETLKRIVDTGKILASARNMPGGIATVSFSALPPRDVIPLMKYRARYRQMSFEPYGIGLRKDIGLKAGIMPVQYYDAVNKPEISSDSRWLWQSHGRITDWRAEKEYRYRSDFAITEQLRSERDTSAMILFCRTSQEAKLLRCRYSCEVISFLP